MSHSLDMLHPFIIGGFEDWVEDLIFVGSQIMTDDDGHSYEEDGVTVVIPDCLVQPFNDAQVSINPEGVRERVEKSIILPSWVDGVLTTDLITVEDNCIDSAGVRYQVIFFKDWHSHVELKIRRW